MPLKPNQRTRLGQALYALGQAGMLSGREISLNRDAAIHTFLHLSKADPKNSFPLLFLAAMYKEKGDLVRSEIYVRKATGSEMSFNSYLKNLVEEVYLNNASSSAEIHAAFSLWGGTPIPNYQHIKTLIDEFPEYAESISMQMMADGFKEELVSDLDWIPIEYAIGRSFYKKYVNAVDVPDFQEIVLRTHVHTPYFSDNPDCRAQMGVWRDYLTSLKQIN